MYDDPDRYITSCVIHGSEQGKIHLLEPCETDDFFVHLGQWLPNYGQFNFFEFDNSGKLTIISLGLQIMSSVTEEDCGLAGLGADRGWDKKASNR